MAIAKSLQTRLSSWADVAQQTTENFEMVGTFADVLEFLGADRLSGIRQKEKNPYVTMYREGQQPKTFMFSNSLASVHSKEALSMAEVLSSPVYMFQREINGENVEIVVLGVAQGSITQDDVVDFLSLKQSLKSQLTK